MCHQPNFPLSRAPAAARAGHACPRQNPSLSLSVGLNRILLLFPHLARWPPPHRPAGSQHPAGAIDAEDHRADAGRRAGARRTSGDHHRLGASVSMRTALQHGCCCGLCAKCRDWHRQITPLNPVGAAMRPGAALTSNKCYFKGWRLIF